MSLMPVLFHMFLLQLHLYLIVHSPKLYFLLCGQQKIDFSLYFVLMQPLIARNRP